jgi:hypothetical protein
MVAVERRSMGWTPISVLGPMGRTVADTCLLYATQIGQHDSDPLSFPIEGDAFAEPWPVDLGSLKVAWTEDFGGVPVERGIRQTMRAKMKAMKHLFRSLDEVKMDLGEADRCFDVVRAVNFVARYRDAYEKNKELLGPNIFYTSAVQIVNPTTGVPYPNNVIPQNQLSTNGIGLLNAYPKPNTVNNPNNWIDSALYTEAQRKDSYVVDFVPNDKNHFRFSVLNYNYNDYEPHFGGFGAGFTATPTPMSPFIPPAACPGMLQRYSYLPVFVMLTVNDAVVSVGPKLTTVRFATSPRLKSSPGRRSRRSPSR